MLSCFSHVQLFVTPWTVAHEAPLSIGFSRQEYWSGLPFPSPGDLPDSGIESASLMSDRPIPPKMSWNAVSFVPQVAIYPHLLEVSWIKCPIQQKIVCNVMHACCCFSHLLLFVTLWSHQAPLFIGFSRQEHWSGLPCSPGMLQGIFLTQGSNLRILQHLYFRWILYC